MIIKARTQRNTYFDSITLMKIARTLTAMPGVEDAAAVMATAPNVQLLAEAGLGPLDTQAGPGDVLLVVRASDEESAQAALEAAQEQLARRSISGASDGTSSEPEQPRSLEQAARLQPDARLALISVPGPYAALESEQALRAGLHVFLFSDNVALDDEIALKHLARESGLLLMGPDCGTAMLNGVGLGFVNVVPRGPIGIVGASGTGIQQVMSLIAQEGNGVSQVIGCGGRDLSEAVGAITTIQGIQLLQADEQTEVIVLISKPPAPSVAQRVIEEACKTSKPVVVIFVGADHDALQSRYGDRVTITHTLTEAAQKAVALCKSKDEPGTIPAPQGPESMGTITIAPPPVVIPPVEIDGTRAVSLETSGTTASDATSSIQTPGDTVPANTIPIANAGPARDTPTYQYQKRTSGQERIVALFSGGTLCDEAMHIWAERVGPVYSNIPLEPAWRLSEGQRAPGHSAIDFGADEYTRGRPHPMIDPSLRLKRFQEEAGDPGVAVILLDIVLGYCSHPDPAEVYVPAIVSALEQAANANRLLACVISLCGTEDDPQRLSAQVARFREAGAEVFTSNAEAATRCAELVS
ncbi:MAG: hypothetical protein M3Z08_17780 [Chloroflexota bacterium]|nr:hypothetical protein [Chloroflexota bacterium]